MVRKWLRIGVILLAVTGAAVASAAGVRKFLSASHTFRLTGGKTRTFRVGYPDALKYGRSRYSGRLTILMPSSGEQGSTPLRRKVHILSRGSCEGGSDYCARVRNSNAAATDAVQVRIRATTELPPGKHS